MNRRTVTIVAAIALLAIVGGVAFSLRSRPIPQGLTPTATAGSAPQQTEVPLVADPSVAPILVQRTPARGEALQPNGAIALTFDRPMDSASVEAAFAIQPAVAGKLSWPDAQTVVFQPNQQLPRATALNITLNQTAKGQDGATLNDPLRINFTTSGFLEVGQVIPADGAQDVATTAAITVMFNRPVVPLTAVEQQGSLPQPLSFEPAIAGTGEWLNSAIYVFTPSQPLSGGTRYTGRVAADLRDTDGNPLQSAFSWQFSTARPQVLSVTPDHDATGVSVEPGIRVQFNQPIDTAAALNALTLRDAAGAAVPFINQTFTDTLLITPSQRLAFDSVYQIQVAAGVPGAAGGDGLAQPYTSSFRTAPLPKIIRTEPADGARDVNPYGGFSIVFNAPIDPDTVMPNIQFTPALSATQVYTYFDATSLTFYIGMGERPSTDFAVQIGPNIADPFGNTTGQTLNVRFRTASLAPSQQLVSMNGIATYDARRPAQIALNTTNLNSAVLALYRLPSTALQQSLYTLFQNGLPAGASELRRWNAPLNAPLDTPTLNRVNLREDGGPLEPGLYVVQLNAPQYGTQNQYMLVSRINLTLKSSLGQALVWANDIESGAPVPNLVVEIFEDGDQMRSLGTITTDANGVASLKLKRQTEYSLVAIAREPFAAISSAWAQTISPWQYSANAQPFNPGLYATAYTDRPIYRPGQQVHFRGLVRNEADANFSLAQVPNIQVTVQSPTGEQVFDQQLAINQHGTFNGDLKLGEGAALGQYTIMMQIGDRSFASTFQVAAYRPPEFEVSVAPQQSEAFRGVATTATVKATYLFGGPVANAPVTWNVLATPYHFAPAWASRYTFDSGGGIGRCWECWWMPVPQPMPILSGSGTTDAQGQVTVTIPANVLDSLKHDDGVNQHGSYEVTIEAVATGRDNQAIAGRDTIVVHAAGVYVGLASTSYLATAGQAQTIDLVTADPSGKQLPNQAVSLEFQRVTWTNKQVTDANGSRWVSEEQVEVVGTQTVTTDGNGQAKASFTPDKAGAYRVVATARDSGGREARTTLMQWVAGDGYIPWRRNNDDSITLVADKTSYKPGETATILIPSPFQGPHYVLITVERGNVISHEVRRVENNSIVFQLPITAQYAPNIYVSAMLFSGGSGDTLADQKLGVLPLSVDLSQQTLNVELKANTPQTEPGSKVRYDVHVTDSAGQPVAAELSLDLVDKAVLNLAPRPNNQLRDELYGPRSLGVSTASGLTVSGDRTQQQVNNALDQARGGGGDTGAVLGAAPEATAAPAAEAAPMQRDAAQAPTPTIRSNFADTAYWNPSISTDAAGNASVELALPDNLTTWVLRGVGLTDDTRVGEGTVNIIATKPLLVRPVTPRFFVVGDRAELSANITNNTDTPLETQVALAASGLDVTSQITQTVQVPAHGEAEARWTAIAQDAASADLVFSAAAGQFSDASKPRLASNPDGTLPIYRYIAPENVGTGGQLSSSGARTEVIALPPNADKLNGELTVRLDPSLAAGMRNSLSALEHYEYECAEQTVSRFLPNVLTSRALKDLGISNPELEAKLPGLVAEGLNRLTSQQNEDGGWGWWPDAQSNPHVSAYVVFGLIKAREAGYSVPDDMLQRGMGYMTTVLVSTGSDTERSNLEPTTANQQAWLLFVLAEGGRGDSGKLNELFNAREKLSFYARALLAMGLQKSGAAVDDSRIKALLSDLNTAAILSATGAHWEENERDWWSMNTDTRTTAIVLEALTRLDPNNQLAPNVVRWLMVARQGDTWATTQESAWSLIALTDWMVHSGELKAEYDYGVQLNGTEQASGHIAQADVNTPIVLRSKVADLLHDSGNRLVIGRSDGPGQLYYTAQLQTFLPVPDIKALDRGVIVSRRYTLASCEDGPKCPDVRNIKVGDVLRVELSIVAPSDLHYVVVEDPLAAGVEAIDTNLATTSVLAEGPTNRPVARGPEEPMPVVEDTIWRPWWNWYSRVEMRDSKVALFADQLPKGSYLFSYTVRATQAGEYRVIPTTASEMYFPEVYGRGDGAEINITP